MVQRTCVAPPPMQGSSGVADVFSPASPSQDFPSYLREVPWSLAVIDRPPHRPPPSLYERKTYIGGVQDYFQQEFPAPVVNAPDRLPFSPRSPNPSVSAPLLQVLPISAYPSALTRRILPGDRPLSSKDLWRTAAFRQISPAGRVFWKRSAY